MDFETTLDSVIKDNYFWFIKNSELVDELNNSITYVFYLSHNHIKENGKWISKMFYQTAVITMWSIVEALLYEYVFEYLKKKTLKK